MAMRASSSSGSVAKKSSPAKPVWRGAAPSGGVAIQRQSSTNVSTPERKNAERHGARMSRNDAVGASPMLNPNIGRGDGLLRGMEGDESALLEDKSFDGRELAAMSLLDSPDIRGLPSAASSSRLARQSASSARNQTPRLLTKKASRPSWGPRASAGTTSSSPSKGKMRLLEGINDAEHSQDGKARTLGTMSYGNKDKQKARQSIFARPTQSTRARTPSKQATTPTSSPARSTRDADLTRAEEDVSTDSLYKGSVHASSSGNVRERVAAIEAGKQASQADVFSGAASNMRKSLGGNAVETPDQLDAQLVELKRLNGIFESYEAMLQAGAAQVDDFQQRIADTNALLDMYIDLMKQTDRTQQLLLDPQWRGTTAEEVAIQALEAELQAREAQRIREQEEAAAAARAAAEEKARREEAARASQRRATDARGSVTGRANATGTARGAGGVRPGVAQGAAASARAGSTAASRGRGAAASGTTHTVSRSAATASTASAPRSTSGGLNNRYANVRSSGYGPR